MVCMRGSSPGALILALLVCALGPAPRQTTAAEPPETSETPDRVWVLRFDAGSTRLSETARSKLAEVARQLAEHEELAVRIVGHSDNQGLEERSLRVSRERARRAAGYLTDTHGIAADRIHTLGRGSARPVASNQTEEGRGKNRRAVVVLEAPAEIAPSAPAEERSWVLRFAPGSSELSAVDRSRLGEVAALLEEMPRLRAKLAGHCDVLEAESATGDISQRRLEAVAAYLSEQLDVPAERIAGRDFGARKPVAPNDTRDGRRLNRRVVVVLEAAPSPVPVGNSSVSA